MKGLVILVCLIICFSSCKKEVGLTSGKLSVKVDGKTYKNKGIVTANRILGLGVTSDIISVSASLGVIRNVSVIFAYDNIVEGEEIELFAQDNSANTIMYTDGKYQDYNHNQMEKDQYLGKITITKVENKIGGEVSGVFEATLLNKKEDEVNLTEGTFTAYIMN